MTRPLSVRIADKNLFSPRVNRSFTLKKVSQTSRSAVSPAVMNARVAETLVVTAALGRCLMRFVQSAERHAGYLLNRVMTDPFIAAIASEDK